MKIIFTTSDSIVSKIIKLFTSSPWHHVGVVVGTNVIEARTTGVVISTLREFKSRGKYHIVDVHCDNESKAVEFLHAQVGKDYDFAGAIGLPFRTHWQDDTKWYCSELVAATFRTGGSSIVRDGLRGVSPRDLWVLPLE